MNYRRVSLLCATTRQPDRLAAFLGSYYATTSDSEAAEIIFRVENDDADTLQLLSRHPWPIIVGPRHPGHAHKPASYNDMARLATGDILVAVDDGVIIETLRWPQRVIEAAGHYPDGIFYFNFDTGGNDEFTRLFCVSRKVVDRWGFIYDVRLQRPDKFIWDVFDHFGRVIRLPNVTFRHTAEAIGRETPECAINNAIADTESARADSYRRQHEASVSEAITKLDPEGEFLATQALLRYESYQPEQTAAVDSYWPPSELPLPWSARRGSGGIPYCRDEVFELFKAVTSAGLSRRCAFLAPRNNGMAVILWGELYDRVVSVHAAGAPTHASDIQIHQSSRAVPIRCGKYRIEIGEICNTPFMYEVLERTPKIDALILDYDKYPQLISPYFLIKRAMTRPSLIAVMNTGLQEGKRNSPHPRRFVDDLESGRLDGVTHRFRHIELQDGNGISYEIQE